MSNLKAVCMDEKKVLGLGGTRLAPFLLKFFLASAVLISCRRGDVRSDSSERLRLQEAYGRLPLSFEANQGQVDAQAKFLARWSGGSVFLTSRGAVFALKDEHGSAPTASAPRKQPQRSAFFRMELVGSNPSAIPVGLDELSGKANYFIGNEPSKWRTEIPTFGKVKYWSVYPGVDLVYYGNQQQLEYDFVLAPGADPSAIRLAFEGVDALEIDGAGHLILTVAGRHVAQRRPCIYEEMNGRRTEIGGGYVLAANKQVAFRLDGHDSSKSLVIDPVLDYSTYLGGSMDDRGLGIAVDGAGHVYVTGDTFSPNFPTASPYQPARGGDVDAFVAKLNAAGSALVYSTYLGGNGADAGHSIAVDGSGHAYVTGVTTSTNFPTASPLQSMNHGNADAFVTKLNAAGSALVYSTYLGGSANDFGNGIAVDSAGSVYVTGSTASTNFPTASAQQPTSGGGSDAFVAKLNAAGSALLYSTYLGGSADDSGSGIAVDGSGNAYVAGSTASANFPTASPLQRMIGGSSDAFVAKLNAAGSALVYSTYLGGSANDVGNGIAVDGSGNAYVTGGTFSTDFPTANPLQRANGGTEDAFVTKLNATGSTLVYSTYLGGDSFDYATGIAVDGSGNAYVSGGTSSTNFPSVNALQAYRGNRDAFVAKVNAAGSALRYATYLGGTRSDTGNSIAVDRSGNAYVTGETDSTDFPTAHPLQQATGGGSDALVAKLGPTAPVVSNISPTSGPTTGGTTVMLTGSDFSPAATLSIGGVPATNISVLSATQLRAQTGPHAAAMVDVTIANPDGQSATLANGFTYVSDADGGTLPDGDPTAGGSPNELGHSGGCSETSGLGFSPWIALALLLCIVLRRGPFLNKRP